MPWLTPGTARSDWADSAGLDEETMLEYLAAAKAKVIAYAPELPAPIAPATETEPPATYVLAQRAVARDLWNALHAKVTAPGEFGLDSYTVSTFPMSWHVQDLLRPNSPRASSLVG